MALSSATGIELVEINTRTYALVVSSLDNAMQIIDITHPQLSFSVSTVHMSTATDYTGLIWNLIMLQPCKLRVPHMHL